MALELGKGPDGLPKEVAVGKVAGHYPEVVDRGLSAVGGTMTPDGQGCGLQLSSDQGGWQMFKGRVCMHGPVYCIPCGPIQPSANF